MSRWLTAIVVLAGTLAVGAVAFLNHGEPEPVHLAPGRTVALPLGMALAGAFAAGAAMVALLWLGGAAGRWRRGRRERRATARRRAAATRERVTAERLLDAGDADAARARLADVVPAHGEDERLLELLAGAAEQSGDLAAAVDAVERARRRLPASPRLTRRLCRLYAAAGRWDDALALERELVRGLGPPAAATEAEIARLRGLRFEAAAADPEPTRAVRRLLRVAAEHPAFVPAWVVAGDRLRAAGETARARTVYGRGARVRPASVLLERLEAVDVAERRPERTVRTLDRLQRLHPRDAGVLAALVRQHLRANALEAAEAALDRWPADAAACPRLDALRGECARRRGRLEQAVVHLARAAEVRAAAPRYRCRACGAPAATWAGRCAGCGRWDVVDADPASLDGIPSDLLMSAPSRSTVENRCVTDSPG